MTAVEISRNDIKAYHSKAVGLGVAMLKNKERPISNVQLVWFGATGESFPFIVDSELKMNNRMPFSKLKERFPAPLFSQLPCLGKGEGSRSDLRVGYCEIRGYNDPSNNVLKTAEYLSLNKWIGIINTSEGAKIYLMPTCVISHELGITHANHPQMLHGVFVKKIHRESRGQSHLLQRTFSPSPENVLKESSQGNHGKQPEEATASMAEAQKRRVSFAPILHGAAMNPDCVVSKVGVPTCEQGRELKDTVRELERTPAQDKAGEMTAYQEGDQASTPPETLSSLPTTILSASKDDVSPGSEISEEGSTASSLSSSTSLYELPQSAKLGRGKRGRTRGKRGRGKGSVSGEIVGAEVSEMPEDTTVRGRGGRGRKKRGRGSRGSRGRGRGKGGGTGDTTTVDCQEDVLILPNAKRARLSLDLIAEKEKSARATNTVLYQILDGQATSITAIQQSPIKTTPVALVSPQLSVSQTQKLAPHAQLQLHILPLQLQTSVQRQQQSPEQSQLQKKQLSSSSVEESAPILRTEPGPSDQTGTTGHTSSSVEPMTIAEPDTACARDEPENVPKDSLDNGMTESDFQVQEEVVSIVQNEQVADQMEVDFGPYFQAPKPPRRVSLLEYKERMKGKKRSEETQDLDASAIAQAKQMKPLTEGGEKDDCTMIIEEETVKPKPQDVQMSKPTVKAPIPQDTNVSGSSVSQTLHPVTVDVNMADSTAKIYPLSEKHSSPVSSSHTGNASQPKDINEPSSIQWPSDSSSEMKKKDQLSATSGPVTQMISEKRKQSLTEVPAGGRLEREVQSPHRREEDKQGREREREEKVRSKEKLKEEKEKKLNEDEEDWKRKWEKEEREKERNQEEDLEEREKDKERAERSELRKEKDREKNLTSKVIDVASKTGEAWKSSSSYSDPRLPARGASPSAHPTFNIPIHVPTKSPRFHPHRFPLPRPTVPIPQPPPPQPFLGFPPHPHPPFPAPFNPPPPRPAPQTDVWNMFGNLFAQHNLFPAEEPPPPPPHSPSPPPLPPLRFGSSRQMSPRRSPPPHRVSSPCLSPPSRRSPTPMSPRSPSPSPDRIPFRSRTKSRSQSPVKKTLALDPKPRQLDAKQFRIISDLVKRTTVDKCDASVQVVPPRMVSEGTQDGRGFKLCNTASQVGAKTRDASTLTDLQPKLKHRYVQTSTVPTRNSSTQTQPKSISVASQTMHESKGPLEVVLDALEAGLEAGGCNYITVDSVFSTLEDWLSRQASLSTDTGSTSDYEPTDMSCDEDDDKGGCDGVFVSPEDPAMPSPVVSGASNISEGDLSDIVSRSPSDRGKGETTDIPTDVLYSPSHPLESSEEYEEEESRLPSPPPLPPSYTLISAPPPPTVSSTNRVTGGLPPWARGDPNTPLSDPSETDNKETEERMDVEEAFADQMLEEQLTESRKSTKQQEEVKKKHPFGIFPLPFVDCRPDKVESNGEKQKSKEEKIKEEINKEETEDSVEGPGPPVTAVASQNPTEVDIGSGGKCDTREEGLYSVGGKNGSSSENISQSEVCNVIEQEKRNERKRVREDDNEDLPIFNQPTDDHSSKPPLESTLDLERGDQNISSGVNVSVRTRHQSTSSRDEVESSSYSIESTFGNRSQSASPRRSIRQRQRSEKLQATTKLSTSKAHKPDIEVRESQDLLRGKQHKYETRQRSRSEVEDDQLNEREERWELRSRQKYQSDDSGTEKRELRPRNRGGKEDNKSKSDAKKKKGKKGQEVDKSSRIETRQTKPMVPTLQAFEDESNNYVEDSVVSSHEKSQSSIQKGSLVVTYRCRINEQSTNQKLQVDKKGMSEEESDKIQDKNRVTDEGEDECYLRSVSLPPFKVAKTSPTGSPPTPQSSDSAPSPASAPRSISSSPPGFPAVKKKPILTKDELLAMVRAKKKSVELNQAELPLQSVEKSSEDKDKDQREPPLVKGRLDMKELMFNFQKHMQTVSARKVSDASWIHPWSHPFSSSGSNPPRDVMIRFPPHLLAHPPPPPPGPPPASSKPVTPRQPRSEPSETDLPSGTPLHDTALSSTIDTSSKEQVDEKSDITMKRPETDEDEKALQDSVLEAAEKMVVEETVSDVVDEGVQEAVAKRVQTEELLCEKVLESLEEKVIKETAKDAVGVVIEGKVKEWLNAEDLQESAMGDVEDIISKEIVAHTMEEGIKAQIKERIQAEEFLQEKALETVEGSIVMQTVTNALEEGITRKLSERFQAEEILQERLLKILDEKIVQETVTAVLIDAIQQKVVDRIKAEEFLQERAAVIVEDQIITETLSETLSGEVHCDAATSFVEDQIITETLSETLSAEIHSEAATSIVEEQIITETLTESLSGEVHCDAATSIVEEQIINETLTESLSAVHSEAATSIVEEQIINETLTESLSVEVHSDAATSIVEEQIIKETLSETLSDEIHSEAAISIVEEQIINAILTEALSFEVHSEAATYIVENQIINETLSETLSGEIYSEVAVRIKAQLAAEVIGERILDMLMEIVARETELTTEVISSVERQVMESLEDTMVCDALEREDKIILELEELVLEELQCDFFEELKEEVVQEAHVKEEILQLCGSVLEVVEDQLFGEIQTTFAKELMTEALVELEEKAIRATEEKLFVEIQQVLVDEVMIHELHEKVADKVLDNFVQDLEGKVGEEAVIEEEKRMKEAEHEVTAITLEGVLVSLENEAANIQVNSEEAVTIEVEKKVCQALENEVIDLLQTTIAIETTTEGAMKQLEERVTDTLEESYLNALLVEIAGEMLTIGEEAAAETEERVSRVLVEECVDEGEEAVAGELSVVEDIEDKVVGELMGQVAKQEIVEERVVDILEDKIIDHLEEDAALHDASTSSQPEARHSPTTLSSPSYIVHHHRRFLFPKYISWRLSPQLTIHPCQLSPEIRRPMPVSSPPHVSISSDTSLPMLCGKLIIPKPASPFPIVSIEMASPSDPVQSTSPHTIPTSAPSVQQASSKATTSTSYSTRGGTVPTVREYTTKRSGSVQECVEEETSEPSSPQPLVIRIPLAVLEPNALKVLVGGEQESVVGKKEVEPKEVRESGEEPCTAEEERPDQDSTGSSIPPDVPVSLSPLVGESDATSTTVNVESMRNAALDNLLEDNDITLKDIQGTTPGAAIMGDTSVSLQSPEKYDSPVASPMTGHSSLSPLSLNGEEMMLRLEASLSSAPETDSDQEVEHVEEETGGVELMSCDDDNAHIETKEKGLQLESETTKEATPFLSPTHSKPESTQILSSSAVSTGVEKIGNEPLTSAIVTSSAEHRVSQERDRRSPSVESGEIWSDDETAHESADEGTTGEDNSVHQSSKDIPTSTLPPSFRSSPETVASERLSSDSPPPPPPPPPPATQNLHHCTPPWALLKPSQQMILTEEEEIKSENSSPSDPEEKSPVKTSPRRLNPLLVMSVMSVDKGARSPTPADPDSTMASKEAPDEEDCAVVSSSRDFPDEEVDAPTSTGDIQDLEAVGAPLKTKTPTTSQSRGPSQQEPKLKFSTPLPKKSSSPVKELPPSSKEDDYLLSAIDRDFISAPVKGKGKSPPSSSLKFPSESDGKSSEENPLSLGLSKSASSDDIMPLFPKQVHRQSRSPSTESTDLVEKRQTHSWRAGIGNNPWQSFSDDERLDSYHKHPPSLMQMTSNSPRGHQRHRQPHHYRPRSHPYNMRSGNTERPQPYSPAFLPLPAPRFVSPFPPDAIPPLFPHPPRLPSYMIPSGRPPPGGHFPPPYFDNRNHYGLSPSPYRQGPYF